MLLNPFMAHWRWGTRPSLVGFTGDVPGWWCPPWHISPGIGDLSPWQLSHKDCGSGHGEQPGLGTWMKAEEDWFQKMDNVPEKKNVSCSDAAEWAGFCCCCSSKLSSSIKCVLGKGCSRKDKLLKEGGDSRHFDCKGKDFLLLGRRS